MKENQNRPALFPPPIPHSPLFQQKRTKTERKTSRGKDCVKRTWVETMEKARFCTGKAQKGDAKDKPPEPQWVY